VVKKKKPLLLPKHLLLTPLSKLAKLLSKLAKLLSKLAKPLLTLLLPLLRLLPLMLRLLLLLAKRQPLLAPLLAPLLRLPSNTEASYEKPAFGPVFLRLQKMSDALDSLGQTRKRLGVGKTHEALGLESAEIHSRRDRHPGVFQQTAAELKAVVAMAAAVGIQIERALRGDRQLEAEIAQGGQQEIAA